MSDAYQAIYDATRSALRNTDVGAAVRSACQLDASYAITSLQQEFSLAAYEIRQPSVLYRPQLSVDGNQWCALYGENLQNGVAGFGDSPALAMADFDRAWTAKIGVAP